MTHDFKVGDVVRFKCWNIPGSRTATITAIHEFNPSISSVHASVRVQRFPHDAPTSTDEISVKLDEIAIALEAQSE